MNAAASNHAVVVAGETLIESLEGFVEDCGNLVEKEKLQRHIKAMHQALADFDKPLPGTLKHNAASGLC